MKEVQLGDLRVTYAATGNGPALVLLHGILGDHRGVRWQTEGLADDFSVFAWDAPGCGRSTDPPERWRMPEYADCLPEWLTVAGIDRPHVLGVSWGGSLALEFYRRHPKVPASLVLADAYAGWAGSLPPEVCAARVETCLRQSELPAAEFIPSWIPGLLTDAAPAHLVSEVEAMMSEFHPVGYRAIARSLETDLRDVLAEIRVPTLLLWGEHDQRAPLPIGEELNRSIPGSELVVVPGAGHLSNAEAPDAFNTQVRRFLRSVKRS